MKQGRGMEDSPISPTELLKVLVDFAQELATVMLDFDGAEFLAYRDTYPEGAKAAFVTLEDKEIIVRVGIAASAEGLDQISRALFCMEDDEDVPDDDVADAVGEVANTLSGKIVSHMDDLGIDLTTSPPVFVQSPLDIAEGMEAAFAEVMLGRVPVSFVLIISKPGE
ncbi:MAG: hypothetical protein GY854_14345 [Deltaproteobacteria bacterium]|nr:hypothetical protein [Deltaproteobacteria bacterium]